MFKYIAAISVVAALTACSGGGPSATSIVPQTRSAADSAVKGDAVSCTPVTTSKGAMTAAIVATAGQAVNPSAPTVMDVDATGCDIGVYIPSASSGVTISYTRVHDANQYGVFNDGAVTADVDNSTVTNIGNHNGPEFSPNGVQTGVGIVSYGGQITVFANNVNNYQKNGMSFESKAHVVIKRNVVTGLGKVNFIAQNGIEVYGASATTVTGNLVTQNWYTGPKWSATGYLFANFTGPDKARIKATNHAQYNQTNYYVQ